MRFMNEFDLVYAQRRHLSNSQPNRLGATLVVAHLADWANTVSDGWAYWPKPVRAAARLIEIADNTRAVSDVTDAELAAAVKPVKAFLTRCAKVPHGLHPSRPMVTPEEREIILRASEPVA